MKLRKWELALIMALGISMLLGAGLVREQRELSDRLIRLHVVANSDSSEDQALKLTVRDAVLAYLKPLLDSVADRAQAAVVIERNMDAISDAARKAVFMRGHDHDLRVSLGFDRFPTREYETFTLPAGLYKALRVEIGANSGRNWWCVVFPPLCADSAVSASDALEALDDDQVALITQTESGHVVRFRVLEWIERVRNFIA